MEPRETALLIYWNAAGQGSRATGDIPPPPHSRGCGSPLLSPFGPPGGRGHLEGTARPQYESLCPQGQRGHTMGAGRQAGLSSPNGNQTNVHQLLDLLGNDRVLQVSGGKEEQSRYGWLWGGAQGWE